MKQPKKRWAWTARQRGRQGLYARWEYTWRQPAGWFVRHKWHRHRSQTRQAMHRLLCGADEATVQLPFHHKRSAHYDWL